MRIFTSILLVGLISFGAVAQIPYPETKKVPVTDTYHGMQVTDEYQWLEPGSGPEIDAWVDAQNELSEKYLGKMARSTRTEGKMNRYMFRKMAEYETGNLNALSRDTYYYTLYYNDYNDTPDLFYRKGYRGKEKILVDTEDISSKDEIVIDGFSNSEDDNYLAYAYNRNGSDWKEIQVVEPRTRKRHRDLITHTKSGVAWLGEGFFYQKYPCDSLTGKSIFPELRYHRLGQAQDQDQLIFRTNSETEFLSLFRSENEEMYIVEKEDFGRRTYSYYFLDPTKSALSFRPLLLNIPYDLEVVDFRDNKLIVMARIKENNQLIAVPLDAPQEWKILSPQYSDAVYKDHKIVGDRIVMTFQGPKNDIISLLDFQGQVLKELPMPAGISVADLNYRKEFDEFFFKMQSFIIPPVLTKLDLDSFEYSVVGETEVNFDFKDYSFTETVFNSHDGVEVPIFIVYKKELTRDGNTPFLLKTYGGYNHLGSPSYDPGVVYFIENGGAFAYVNVRGGGKLGNDWWDAGRRQNKKNSYLDLIAAAEYLITEGFTGPKKIAVTGASHGGLVTAAAVLARPDLFGSAVMDVAVTDMLRFENYSVGATSTNLYEFGSVKNKEDFENLYSYSPYHTIKEGENYPPILLVTGTHDSRVPAFHSYKFAARLQDNPGQKNPVYLWTQTQTGHSGATDMNAQLKEYSYIYGFLWHQLQNNLDL